MRELETIELKTPDCTEWNFEIPYQAMHKSYGDNEFDSDPLKALTWETRVNAEAACLIYERRNIGIELAQGDNHRCTDFRVEEIEPDKFVVFCYVPLMQNRRSEG